MRNISSLAHITIVVTIIRGTASFQIPSSSFGVRRSNNLHVTTLSASTSPSSFSNGGIDLERARECATNGGVCDLEEMEQLRDALKAERMKDFLSSSLFYLYPTGAPSSPWNPNDSLEKRLLEDNLSQQLQHLKEQEAQLHHQHHQVSSFHQGNKKSSSTMTKRQDFIPHATATAATDTSTAPSNIPSPQDMNAMIEFLNEPSTEEMMTVCFVIAAMMLFPFVLSM